MNELAITRTHDDLDDVQRTATLLAVSGYFEVHKDPTVALAQVATKILAGREMGYGPFASVQGIHIIQGKPSVSANLMAAAIKAHPAYNYRVRTLSDTECSIEFFERGEPVGVSTFTAKDAQAASLTGKAVWKQFPRNMLFARAISNGVRWYCPDVFAGNAVYVPEELGDYDTTAEYAVVTPQPAATPNSAPPPASTPQQHATPAPASAANPFDDSLSDDEAKLLAAWHDEDSAIKAAQTWAVEQGACKTIGEAIGSMNKIVKADFGGKILAKQLDAILVAYMRHQWDKLAAAIAEQRDAAEDDNELSAGEMAGEQMQGDIPF